MCIYYTDVNKRTNYHPVDITVTCWREAESVATEVEQVILFLIFTMHKKARKRLKMNKILVQYSRTSVSSETVS